MEREHRARFVGEHAREDLEGRHHAVRAAAAGVLHAVRDAAVTEHAQAIESEAGPRAISHEALATFVIVGFDAHRGLEVEAVALGAERAPLLRREARVGVLGPGGSAWIQNGERAAAKGNLRARTERGAGCALLRSSSGRSSRRPRLRSQRRPRSRMRRTTPSSMSLAGGARA